MMISKALPRRTSARLSESVDLSTTYRGTIPRIDLMQISIIIPVRDNPIGIDRFLETFFTTQGPQQWPKEIIIVDNNSRVPLSIDKRHLRQGLAIHILSCTKQGPAAARNAGVRTASGEWLLFCDSDCVPTGSLLTGYLAAGKPAIAYAGNVKGTSAAYLSKYYDDEETLIPYRKVGVTGAPVPLYVVTANALVWKTAFEECGGFDESFSVAGGEDVDLGRRLWQIGNIEYEPNSVILHNFEDGFIGLCRRFLRYGRGNRHLEHLTGIRMRPHFRKPRKFTALNQIAMLAQYTFMLIGYYQQKRAQRWSVRSTS